MRVLTDSEPSRRGKVRQLIEKHDLDRVGERLEREIEQLRSEKQVVDQALSDREQVESPLDELETGIKLTEATIDGHQNRREQLTESIEEVEEMEAEKHDDVLELHWNTNEPEYELGLLDIDLEDLGSTIAQAEARIEEDSNDWTRDYCLSNPNEASFL